MIIQLDRFSEKTVKRLVQSGHWASPKDLINDGLRAASQRLRLWRMQRREFLARFLRPASKEIKRGKLVAFDSGILAQLRTKRADRVRSAPDAILEVREFGRN